MADGSTKRHYIGVVEDAPSRKKKKNSKLEAAMKELADVKAKNVKMAADLKRAQESILSLQTSLGCAKGNTSEVDSLEFHQGNIGPSSTQRAGSDGSMEMSRFMSSVNQISISSITVPECKPEIESEGIAKLEFQNWLDLLKDTMKLAGVCDEGTQFMIFKVKAGPKLLEIYRNTKSSDEAPDSTVYPFANAIHRLQTYFSSGSDALLQRRKLTSLVQKSDESDLSYIMRVGALARMCEFEESKEFEEIVRTVAEHANNSDVRKESLIILNSKGTLTDLVNKVRQIEAININEEYYRLRHTKKEEVTVAPVSVNLQGGRQKYMGKQSRFENQQFHRKEPWDSMQPSVPQWRGNSERCYRCNGFNHRPSQCNSIDKTCLKCGRKGHFQRACKVFIRSTQKRENVPINLKTGSKNINMLDIAADATDEKTSTNDNVGDHQQQ